MRERASERNLEQESWKPLQPMQTRDVHNRVEERVACPGLACWNGEAADFRTPEGIDLRACSQVCAERQKERERERERERTGDIFGQRHGA